METRNIDCKLTNVLSILHSLKVIKLCVGFLQIFLLPIEVPKGFGWKFIAET